MLSFRIMGARTALELPGESTHWGRRLSAGRICSRADRCARRGNCLPSALEHTYCAVGAYNITGADRTRYPYQELMRAIGWRAAFGPRRVSRRVMHKAQAQLRFSPQFVWSQQRDHREVREPEQMRIVAIKRSTSKHSATGRFESAGRRDCRAGRLFRNSQAVIAYLHETCAPYLLGKILDSNGITRPSRSRRQPPAAPDAASNARQLRNRLGAMDILGKTTNVRAIARWCRRADANLIPALAIPMTFGHRRSFPGPVIPEIVVRAGGRGGGHTRFRGAVSQPVALAQSLWQKASMP